MPWALSKAGHHSLLYLGIPGGLYQRALTLYSLQICLATVAKQQPSEREARELSSAQGWKEEIYRSVGAGLGVHMDSSVQAILGARPRPAVGPRQSHTAPLECQVPSVVGIDGV